MRLSKTVSQPRTWLHPIPGFWGCMILTLGLVGSCAKNETPTPGTTAQNAHGKPDKSNSQSQRPQHVGKPIAIAVEVARLGAVVQHYETTATLEAENRAPILSRISGVVEQLLTEEGELVGVNQELLVLEDTEAQLLLRQARVNLAERRSIFERQKASVERGVITQAEFDLARTSFEATEVDVSLAEHDLSYTRITAPFRGTITQRLINIGQAVSVGTPLFEIANFTPLLARVHVPAKELGGLKAGQSVDMTLDSNEKSLRGVIDRISPVIDPTTGTIKLTVRIDTYPPSTRPGDFAHVRVITDHHKGVLRVPNTAVFEDKGQRIVFVAQDNVAQRRVVEIGFIDNTYTEILHGIQQQEQVVVQGQRSLKEGSRVKIIQPPSSKISSDKSQPSEERPQDTRPEGKPQSATP